MILGKNNTWLNTASAGNVYISGAKIVVLWTGRGSRLFLRC